MIQRRVKIPKPHKGRKILVRNKVGQITKTCPQRLRKITYSPLSEEIIDHKINWLNNPKITERFRRGKLHRARSGHVRSL